MRSALHFPVIAFGLFYLTVCCHGSDESATHTHNARNSAGTDLGYIEHNSLIKVGKSCSVNWTIVDENTFLYEHEDKLSKPAGVLHCLVKCTQSNCWSCQINIGALHLEKLTGNVTILNISADFKEEDHEMMKIELISENDTEIQTPKHVDLLIFGNLACDWSCFSTLLQHVRISKSATRGNLPKDNEGVANDLNTHHHVQQKGLYLWNWWESEDSYSQGNFSLQAKQSIGLFYIKSLIIHQDVILPVPKGVLNGVCKNACIPKSSLNFKVAGCYMGQAKEVPPSLRKQKWPNLEYLELQLSNLTGDSLMELNTSLPALKYLKLYLTWNCETSGDNSLPDVLTSFNWKSLHWKSGVVLMCSSKKDVSETKGETLIRSSTLRFLNRTAQENVAPIQVYMYKENVHPFVVNIDMTYKGLRDLSQVTFDMHTHFIKLNLSRNNIAQAEIYQRFTPTIREPPVKVLDLSHNQLQENTLNDYLLFTQLQELYLSHNKYTVVPFHTVSTEELDKFHWRMQGMIDPGWVEKPLSERTESETASDNKLYLSKLLFDLRTLDLSYNKIHQIDLYSGVIDPTLLPIRGLFFQHNEIDKIPNIVFNNRYISVADFSNNYIGFEAFVKSLNEVNLNWLRSMPNNVMTKLELSYNRFRVFNSSLLAPKGVHNAVFLLQNFNVHLHHNPIVCNCTTYKFYSQLAKLQEYATFHLRLSESSTKYVETLDFYRNQGECAEPSKFSGRPLMTIQQYEFKECFEDPPQYCPENCTCYDGYFQQKYNENPGIIVNCTGAGMTEMPQNIPDLTVQLILRQNRIKSLSKRGYMETISVLDLSLNKILTISEDFMSESTANLKHVDLSSNQIIELPNSVQNMENATFNINYNTLRCSCKSVWMKKWLMNSTKYVKDWQSILCFSGPQKGIRVINMIERYPECDGKTTYLKDTVIKLVGGIVSVFIIGITLGVVVFWYRGEIKVWLYARFRWHPWDKGDDDITDKDYDAFVSYSQSDVTWVRNELMPFLESEKNQFQLCVHVRDFVPGVTITKNIMTAIDCSRRTILVLSREFLKSEWCHLEFQAAHQKALQDRSNYLIVILLEDINPKDLDGSLKLYMKTNTYVNAEDAWFERKLLYAMPEKSIAALRNEVRVATKPLVLKVEAEDTEDGENVHEFLESIKSTASYGTWEDESENGDSGAFSETTFGSIEAEHSESTQSGLENSLIRSGNYARESQRAARRKNKKHRRSMVRNLPPLFRRLLNYEHLEESCEEVEGGYIMIHD